MDKVLIREAKENELPIVQKLNHQLFIHDQPYDPLLNMNWPFKEKGEEYFRSKINKSKGVCFVAEVNN
jgi:hypothetical protein